MMTHAVLLPILGPQLDVERYPYPALKKNRAMNTITAITAIEAMIIWYVLTILQKLQTTKLTLFFQIAFFNYFCAPIYAILWDWLQP